MEGAMARTQDERLAEKTAERQFLYELERDFELAPAPATGQKSVTGQMA